LYPAETQLGFIVKNKSIEPIKIRECPELR